MTENLYFLRQVGKNKVEVAKFTDGSTSPSETYLIENSHCNCLGAKRGICKHEKMHDRWVEEGKKVVAFDNSESNEIDLSWINNNSWIKSLA